MNSTQREALSFINLNIEDHDRELAKLEEGSYSATFHIGYITALEAVAMRLKLPAISPKLQCKSKGVETHV